MADSFAEINRLALDLQGKADRVGREAAAVVRRVTHAVERDARALAPQRTGGMVDSIVSDFRGDGRSRTIEGRVGPEAFYGRYVEYGTSRMAPRAFLGPALDRNSPDLVDGLTAVTDPFGQEQP